MCVWGGGGVGVGVCGCVGVDVGGYGWVCVLFGVGGLGCQNSLRLQESPFKSQISPKFLINQAT